VEVIDCYLIPRLAGYFGKSAEDNLMINKDGQGFNSGFSYLKNYSNEHDIPLLVYLHAEVQEIKEGKFDKGGQEIIAFCKQNQIPLISGLESGESNEMYIDQIHFNSAGQNLLARALLPHLKEYTRTCR